MKLFKSTLVAVAAAALLSGCSTYSLEELRHTTPKGNAFQTALSKEYMDFSTMAEKNYDWLNSWHFADKGLLAAYGQEVGPEDLKEWDIPKDKELELEKARAALLAVLTDDVIKNQPQEAADAQFGFDCWVKNQEQRWQEDKIAECRDAFNEAMAKLDPSVKAAAVAAPVAAVEAAPSPEEMAAAGDESALDAAAVPIATLPPANVVDQAPQEHMLKVPPTMQSPKPAEVKAVEAAPVADAAAPVKLHLAAPNSPASMSAAPKDVAPAVVAAPVVAAAAAAPEKPAAPTPTTSYVVFFEWGESQLTSGGQKVIDDVVGTLKKQDDYEVVLKSHTDTSEPKTHDMKLSQARAATVRKRLVDGGVPEDAIRTYVYGEKEPAVQTADGVKEQANRRVEIFLND